MIKQGERLGLPATDSGPNPGDFPIGSVESRAAARAELDRRMHGRFQDALRDAWVVGLTGLPSFHCFPPLITPPDSVEYYQAPDGSIVQAIHRFWEDGGRNGATVFIEQCWPNGKAYRETGCIGSLAELERCARVEPRAVERMLNPLSAAAVSHSLEAVEKLATRSSFAVFGDRHVC